FPTCFNTPETSKICGSSPQFSFLPSPTGTPPPECPMHQASAPASEKLKKAPDVPTHQDRAYEFVECPISAANGAKPTMSDINPANMVIWVECMYLFFFYYIFQKYFYLT
uniref:Uncharacterized protein n=1 Tax=Sinocyclocheilus anshuiensis TaxID=1608454 RepID=A0A671R9B3_9TELE